MAVFNNAATDHQRILSLLEKQPDIPCLKIIETLDLPVSIDTVRRFLRIPQMMPRAVWRAFSIVLSPGTSSGLPCGAQHLFFRLGELFQGGFPAQGSALVRAAL